MDSSLSSHQYIILDACCVINLYASGVMGQIIESNPLKFAITSYVKEKEVLTIFDGLTKDLLPLTRRINLDTFIKSGSLIMVSPKNDEEIRTIIDLAYRLDDGEARTGAIAIHRNWAIGTDDKKAATHIQSYSPKTPIISTLELVKHWVDETSPSPSTISSILRNIRVKARYEPYLGHSLYGWWNRYSKFWEE
jgi:hypothetical protein